MFYVFPEYFFNCIVDLQCCINYCCTAKWLIYTYIYILFHILFHYGLSQDIEYSSLCYTVGPCCSSILYIIVCIWESQTPSPSLPPLPPPPWQPQVSSLSLSPPLFIWRSSNSSHLGVWTPKLDGLQTLTLLLPSWVILYVLWLPHLENGERNGSCLGES